MKDFKQLLEEGDIEKLEKFLKANPSTNVNQIDDSDVTPLHRAAYKGNRPVVEFLLSKNADVNLVTKSQQSALIISIKNANFDISNLLLNREDINVNIADESGFKALDYARDIENESVKNALVRKIAKFMPVTFQDRVEEITPVPSPSASGKATPLSSPSRSILKR